MIDQTDLTVYLVFPVHNRLEDTKAFLDSLSGQTVSNFRLVICDDGSTDGTATYLKESHPEVVVLEGDGSLWWTAGINRCVRHVLQNCNPDDYILTLNNDAILPANYIEQKIQRSLSLPGAIIGSLCTYSNDRSLIETSGYLMDYKKCVSVQLDKPGSKRTASHKGLREVTHLPGKGVMFPVKVFSEVGLYDEAHLPQYHADTDLVLRAGQSGYKVYVDYDTELMSIVNTNNMVLPEHEITLQGIVSTFRGPYSINNYSVRRYFAEKHFPGREARYLLTTYFKIIGGFLIRYLKYQRYRFSRRL